MIRYIIGLLVTIGLIILILVLIFSGNGTPKQAQKVIKLTDYAHSTTARAQLVIEGNIVSNQVHGVTEIDVTPTETSVTTYSGYERTINRTKTYPNNQNSFENFIYGLQRSNFTQGNNDPAMRDERGYCVMGTRSVYTFNDGSHDLFRYWSSSCGYGTYKGDLETTQFLFEHQIPDFNELTSDQSYL